MKFFEKLEIPWDVETETSTTVAGELRTKSRFLNVAQFESCGCHFEISAENGLTNLLAHTDPPKLPNNLEIRAVEALRFVLAQPLEWAVLQTRENDVETVRIGRGRVAKTKGLLGRPLDDRTGQFKGHTWKLFDKYLTHVLRYERADAYHPLSTRVRHVIGASEGSIDAHSLTLAVAVEGVLGAEFPHVAPLSKEDLGELDKALRVINESDLRETTKERISGAIRGWKEGPSAKAKLLSLIDSGVIEKREYDAWRELRNPVAHGRLPDSEDLEQRVHLCHATTTLFYKLIFQAIGYEGKYTDYGTLGWPLEHFRISTIPVTGD
jgi:hypothetical protein